MLKWRKTLNAMFVASLLTLFVSGCTTSGGVIDGCTWVEPISVSRHDTLTDQTAKEILAHNEKWERICGK